MIYMENEEPHVMSVTPFTQGTWNIQDSGVSPGRSPELMIHSASQEI
jgi:hypothetical protein